MYVLALQKNSSRILEIEISPKKKHDRRRERFNFVEIFIIW